MRKPQREEFKTYNDVFDQFTERTIATLIMKHIIDGLEGPISTGKEAVVFSALKGDERLAIKIHRLQTADFNKMYQYIRTDPRFSGLARQRRKIIFAWCQREYKNLLRARSAGIPVPTPKAFLNNVLVMKYIGASSPAPRLHNQRPEHPEVFLQELTTHVKKLYGAGLIHGDLSAFNILNNKEHPVIIDFSHAMPLDDPNAKEYLHRDCKNVVAYFTKIGVRITPEEFLKQVTENTGKSL